MDGEQARTYLKEMEIAEAIKKCLADTAALTKSEKARVIKALLSIYGLDKHDL